MNLVIILVGLGIELYWMQKNVRMIAANMKEVCCLH